MNSQENFSPVGGSPSANADAATSAQPAVHPPQHPGVGYLAPQLPKLDPIAVTKEGLALSKKYLPKFWPLILIAALLSAIMGAGLAAFNFVDTWVDSESYSETVLTVPSLPGILIGLATLIPLGFLVIAILNATTKIAIVDSQQGEAASIWNLSRPLWRTIFVLLAIGLTLAVPYIVISCVPFAGFLFATAMYVVVQAAIGEQLGPIAAIKRCWALVKPQFLQVFLTYLLAACAVFVIGLIICVLLAVVAVPLIIVSDNYWLGIPFILLASVMVYIVQYLMVARVFVRLRELEQETAAAYQQLSTQPATPRADLQRNQQ